MPHDIARGKRVHGNAVNAAQNLHRLAHGVDIVVAACSARVVDVAHIEHGLVGEQKQVVGNLFLLLAVELHQPGALALREHLLVALHHLILHLGLAVAGLRLLLHAAYAALYGLQVAQLQLGVDHLLVAHGVDCAVDVGHVVVVEAAQHVNDGIGLAYVGQKLVAQALALAGAFHKAGNVDNLDGGGHDALGVHKLGQLVEAIIGDGDHPHIGLDGAERKVCRLRLGVRQAVEQSGLAHVGESHNTTLKCHK